MLLALISISCTRNSIALLLALISIARINMNYRYNNNTRTRNSIALLLTLTSTLSTRINMNYHCNDKQECTYEKPSLTSIRRRKEYGASSLNKLTLFIDDREFRDSHNITIYCFS